jgi:hypothetical protein
LDFDDANATWSTEKEIPTGTRIDFSILKVPESLLELRPRKKKTSTRKSSKSPATVVSENQVIRKDEDMMVKHDAKENNQNS